MPLSSTQRASASLKGDAALLYDILTDYDHFAEWLPGIAQSRPLAREGDLAIAEFALAAPQNDRFVFECIHTRNRMVLWRTLEGKAPVSQVEWTIEAGAPDRCQIRLAVARALTSRFFGPYRRFLEAAASLKALERQLATFMPEIALTDESGERILDLVETETGIVCFIRGKKYVLQEESRQSS
jgi:ribosome-associated toxin RatA of RatAB toxin-antitoxin module